MSNTIHATRQATPFLDDKEDPRDTDMMQKFYDNLKAELDVPGAECSMDLILEEIRKDPECNVQLTPEDEAAMASMMNMIDPTSDPASRAPGAFKCKCLDGVPPPFNKCNCASEVIDFGFDDDSAGCGKFNVDDYRPEWMLRHPDQPWRAFE
ncbi:hypothetical protein FA15DRAFT_708663 [Coprinopsis marcescibilis]|uniref:Uncharacterized protein n=1 Tax=Coprinopsis marcescibilis TaxID=230819 RepID=A0A5C3KIT2_COPMA|nr:hypothetical protein FA15DRAFT_708663 [Coprinopsis marcescibilis]